MKIVWVRPSVLAVMKKLMLTSFAATSALELEAKAILFEVTAPRSCVSVSKLLDLVHSMAGLRGTTTATQETDTSVGNSTTDPLLAALTDLTIGHSTNVGFRAASDRAGTPDSGAQAAMTPFCAVAPKAR